MCAGNDEFLPLLFLHPSEAGHHVLMTRTRTVLVFRMPLFAEQGRHDIFRAALITIDRIDTGQGRHAAIATTLAGVERRKSLGIFPYHRHAFAVRSQNQQFSFLLPAADPTGAPSRMNLLKARGSLLPQIPGVRPSQ